MADDEDEHDPHQDERQPVVVAVAAAAAAAVVAIAAAAAPVVALDPVGAVGPVVAVPVAVGAHGLAALPQGHEDAEVAGNEDDERDDGGEDEVGPDLVVGRGVEVLLLGEGVFVVRVVLAVGPVGGGLKEEGFR